MHTLRSSKKDSHMYLLGRVLYHLKEKGIITTLIVIFYRILDCYFDIKYHTDTGNSIPLVVHMNVPCNTSFYGLENKACLFSHICYRNDFSGFKFESRRTVVVRMFYLSTVRKWFKVPTNNRYATKNFSRIST